MASTKEYKIVINGLKESVSEVDALNKQLDNLEKRMNAIDGKGVSVGGGSKSTASLSEEEKLYNQIAATEEKIAVSKEKDYQYLLKIKDELKQAKVEAEGLAAASKLDENNYNLNTMEGIKEKLKDIKREMQTTDIGSDKFKQLTTEANDLNTKLKDIEATYGQFGRNVGNYQSAIQGFEGFKMKIGETEVQFNSLKDAMRSLKNEMGSLEMQNKGNTKEYDQLKQALDEVTKANQRLQSSMKDVENSSKFMDYMLDTMTSFTALASAGKGLSTFFGFDNSKVDESIKKLMALQNALKGLETLKRQMNTNEGFAKIFSSANSAIDAFSTKLLGTKKAAEGAAVGMKTATKASKLLSIGLKSLGIGLLISLIVSLTKKWDKINEAINKSIPALEKFGGVLGWLEGAFNGVINAMGSMFEILAALIRLDFSEIGNIIAKAFKDGMQEVQDDVAREAAATAAENIKLQMDMLVAQHGEEVKYTKQYQQLLKERNDLLAKSYDESTKEGKKAAAEHKVQMAREEKELKDHAKEMARLQEEADEELTRLKIENMKEGLNKTLIQLEEERKAEIAKARETGRNVREIEAEINKKFDKKEEEARKEYAENVKATYKSMLEAINKLQQEYDKELLSNLNETLDAQLQEMMNSKMNIIGEGFGEGWGGQRTLEGIFTYSTNVNLDGIIDDKTMAKAIEYRDILNKVNDALKEMKGAEEHLNGLIKIGDESGVEYWKKQLESIKQTYDEAKKVKDEFVKLNSDNIGIITLAAESEKVDEVVFKKRMSIINDFYDSYRKTAQDNEKQILAQHKIVLEQEREAELDALEKQKEEFEKQNDSAMQYELQGAENTEEAQLAIQQKYQHLSTEYYEVYKKEKQRIQDEYSTKELQAEHNTSDKIKSISEQGYQDVLQELRDFQTASSEAMGKTDAYNSWGILNIKKTSDNLKKVKSLLTTQLDSLGQQRAKLNDDWKNGLITDEAYQNTARELDRMTSNTVESLEKIEDESKQAMAKFVESISVYTQAFSQTLSGILDAVWTAQDAAYEREKEQLEKDTEELEEQLDKQKEITEKYKDDINDIESELSTARGDRRQELIDQLNAQKAAQRASLIEEKRIEKEKEKLKEKADKLDKEQKEKQKDRDLVTAGINAGMAILGAAANHWPLPAIPLVAAATALGVAQIAKIKAQKYAKGGLLEGNSHSQGGIPVGNTGIEVEGKEYIIRKKSTKGNVELLDYINRSERKLNIDDFIDFYSGRVKKNILSTSPARKYANGGELPLLNDGITINDRLLNAFERYAEKPTVVSVVEIEDRMEDVNSVRALAGAV